MTLFHLNLSFSSHLFPCFGSSEPDQEQKLEFLLEPASVTKVLGATALLPCVVTGYPAPHVRWMLGDKLVEERYERVQPDIELLQKMRGVFQRLQRVKGQGRGQGRGQGLHSPFKRWGGQLHHIRLLTAVSGGHCVSALVLSLSCFESHL